MSAVEIVMPRLSDAMEEGTIVRWLKDVGDQIEVGDELVEVETDKATVIYEAEVSGLLSAILVQAGEAQQLGAADRPGRRRCDAAARAVRSGRPLAHARSRGGAARELGVDLAALRGTGPRGRIRLADVEAAADRRAARGPAAGRGSPPPASQPPSPTVAGRRDAGAASACR